MKVYYCGYGGNSWMAEELRPMIEEMGMSLITIHEHVNATIKWDVNTWLGHLKEADIIIAPSNYVLQPAKSANKVTQALSIGKPVICSPLPAYLDVLKKHPDSFLVATTPDEWRENFKLLRDDPDYRKEIGVKALKASQDYSIEAIGKKWLKVFQQEDSVVDIIIPTYCNLRGIKLCIESIRECTDTPNKIIVVNNGSDESLHVYLQQQQNITYIKKDRLNFAQAINVGIKASTSEYVLLLNDDVIVSRGWLTNMVRVCKDGVGIVNPFSNCDEGWLHNHKVSIGGVRLLPGTNTFEEIEPIKSLIHNYTSEIDEIKEQEWVAFYSTLISREVVDKVGLLDEHFTNSGEDVDYCKRAHLLGYKIIQTYKSFVFHFGAVSRKSLECDDKEGYQKADNKTQAYLGVKYSKKTVVLYSGPSWERWSFNNEIEGGIGGSEIWQISLAREFDKLGYRVISFCDLPEVEMWNGGVQYLHYDAYPSFIDQNYIDYFISSRTTDTFNFPVRANKTYAMLHDIFLLSRDKEPIDKVGKYCVLSQWHLDFASNYHNIPKNRFCVTANGIDFNRFDQIDVEKEPYRLHWSSSWDRGLDNVLYLFPFLKKEIPKLELHVYYGCDTWKASCLKKGDKKGLDKISAIEKMMGVEGVFNYGRVNQEELAIAIKKASLLLYPTGFSETFFITGIECQRAGTPIIASNYAGLTSTLGASSILLGDGDSQWAYTEKGRKEFLSETVSILKDRDKWEFWSKKGFENSEKYSWKKVALMWKNLFEN